MAEKIYQKGKFWVYCESEGVIDWESGEEKDGLSKHKEVKLVHAV